MNKAGMNNARISTDRTTEGRSHEDRPQSRQFEAFCLGCLQAGLRVRFQARGASMSSAIRDGEIVYVKPAADVDLHRGEILLVNTDSGFRLHRLVRADACRNVFITRGDSGRQNDPPVRREQILGVAVAKDVRLGKGMIRASLHSPIGQLLCTLARAQRALGKVAFAMKNHPAASLSTIAGARRGSQLLFLLGVLLCR